MTRDKKSEQEDMELQDCNTFKYSSYNFDNLLCYVLSFYFLYVPKLCEFLMICLFYS